MRKVNLQPAINQLVCNSCSNDNVLDCKVSFECRSVATVMSAGHMGLSRSSNLYILYRFYLYT